MIEVARRNQAKAGCASPRSRLPPAAGLKKTRKAGVSIPSGYRRPSSATYKVAVAPIHEAAFQRLSAKSGHLAQVGPLVTAPGPPGLVFSALRYGDRITQGFVIFSWGAPFLVYIHSNLLSVPDNPLSDK